MVQPSLLGDAAQVKAQALSLTGKDTKKTVLLSKLESFLTRRTRSDDLGLRLRGEQLAAGVRFIRMVREGAYELVVGNPPYQGTSKLVDSDYVKQHYQNAKADLYAAFLERGLQLVKPGGLSVLLTMRNWMFISQYSKIRENLLEKYDLRLIGDLETGAFEEVSAAQVVLSVAMTIFCRDESTDTTSIALQPAPGDIKSEGNIERKRAALLAQVGRFEFKTNRFDVIKEKPLIYWWDEAFLKRYASLEKLGKKSPARKGACTSNDKRFVLKPWEVNAASLSYVGPEVCKKVWVPCIMGAKGKVWIEGFDDVMWWKNNGFEVKLFNDYLYSSFSKNIRNQRFYFVQGVAISAIGTAFTARKHRYQSIFTNSGTSLFPEDLNNSCCLLNSRIARYVIESLSPSLGFEVGDVNRLPLFPIESADQIFAQLEAAFTTHETAREPSVEFQQPGPTCWPYAQAWAQRAVDRPTGEPLPPWQPEYEDPKATDWISYAIGSALGRFPLQSSTAEPQNAAGHSTAGYRFKPGQQA